MYTIETTYLKDKAVIVCKNDTNIYFAKTLYFDLTDVESIGKSVTSCLTELISKLIKENKPYRIGATKSQIKRSA